MFRCSECGCEYNNKPDFCDCGNNIFEEIAEQFENNKPQKRIHRPMTASELISRLIFVLCLILSLAVLIFFPKTEDTPQPVQKPQIKKTVQSIPDINTFWIDTKPSEETFFEKIKETISQPKEQKPTPVTTTTTKPKPTKTVSTKQQTTVSKPKQTQTTKPQPKTRTKATTPTTGKPQSASYSYEVINYRTALRQRLFSNLDLYKIEGSGTCGITFAIDENGKLINRNFTFQSDNQTVNDEVYKMLMRTPKFTPPPTSYANKTIKMVFKLTSDSYEIKFLD